MADDPHELPRGVNVSRRQEPPPWQVDALPDHASVHVVVHGSFRLSRGATRLCDLGPGDVLLVGAGPDGEPRLQCVATPAGGATTEPAELLTAVYAPDVRLAAPAVLHLPAAEVQRARGLSVVVGLLCTALRDPSAGQERLARSLLPPLLAYVLHGQPCENDVAPAHFSVAPVAPAAPVDPRLRRALDRLRAAPREPWTVASLAKAAGLSRAAFARRFLAEIGVPPLRYLAELRMQVAARLLAEGDASLASVAAEVGYDSEFAFSRAFKRHTGQAPGVWRRRVRAEAPTWATWATWRTPLARAAA